MAQRLGPRPDQNFFGRTRSVCVLVIQELREWSFLTDFRILNCILCVLL